MSKCLIITLLLVTGCCCFGQHFDEKKFIHYTTINGLSDNVVTGLAQDEFGYIWISTTNGLNRFDGNEIKRIYQTPGKDGLLTDKLRSLQCAGSNLLVSSAKGAQWIDINKNRFTKLIVSDKGPASAFQNDLFDAAFTNHRICVTSTYTGVYAFDSTGKLIFRYDYYKPDSKGNIISNGHYGLAVIQLDPYRVLHFDRKYRMSIYDSRQNSFSSINDYKNSLPHLYLLEGRLLSIRGRYGKNIIFLDAVTKEMIVYDVIKDRLKIQAPPVWFREKLTWATRWLTINDSTAIIYGGIGGLYTVHISLINLQFSYDSVAQFSKQICTTILLDRDSRLWVGTENGLFRQNIKITALNSIMHPLLNNPGINYAIPFLCFLRKNDLLYAGTYTLLPIMILDGNTYKIKKQISFSSLSPLCNQLWHIIEYNKDTLWFATQDGLVWYDEHSGHFNRVYIDGIDTLIQHHAITLLYKDTKGIIWLQSEWGYGVIMYNPATKTTVRFVITDKENYLPLRVVNFVTEDKEGNMWFAENGLIRWNRKKEQFDTLITSYYGFNKDNIKITALSNNEKGDLVFCNENNGVLMYDPQTASYKQISTEQGLQENAAYDASAAGNNYMWVVTHNYITVINQNNFKTISYSYSDSLPVAFFNTIYHDGISKRMLFGYDNEIIWANDSIGENIAKPISFYIDALRIADDTTLLFPEENIELNYRQNNISIHYSALNFDEAESNRYAYRINEKEWLPLGSENVIRFSNLSPGKYEVEIKYYSASDPNSETLKKITIFIQSPFWKRWWFFVLIALTSIATGYILYKKNIHQIRQKASIDKQLAEYEMKALHAQMNPHFIFNSLNSIREMILNNENKEASHFLGKFAHLIRLTLDQSGQTFISLRNTIDYLNRYIEMEQIRNTQFIYSFNVDESLDLDETVLPPMLIQPFIENAIWHGTTVNHKRITITLNFKNQNNQLVCIIDDNGIGIEQSIKSKQDNGDGHTPVGISNIKNRIQLLNEKYNLQSSITIEDKLNLRSIDKTGTLVTLRLPLEIAVE